MHYVVAGGIILCGARDFHPSPPYAWHPGDIVEFRTAIFPIAPFVRFGSLLSADGSGWGIEIAQRDICAFGEFFKVRAAVMHRISGNQFAPGAVVRLAVKIASGRVTLDPGALTAEELQNAIFAILAEGGAPVIGGFNTTAGPPGESVYPINLRPNH